MISFYKIAMDTFPIFTTTWKNYVYIFQFIEQLGNKWFPIDSMKQFCTIVQNIAKECISYSYIWNVSADESIRTEKEIHPI